MHSKYFDSIFTKYISVILCKIELNDVYPSASELFDVSLFINVINF